MIWWVVLLFLAGMTLILAEFVLPGAILGIIGGVLILLSAALGAYTFPDQAVLVVGGEVVGAALCIAGGIFMISKTGVGGGLMLRTSQHIDDGYVNVPTNLSLMGRTGRVITLLRPAGTIVIGEERIDAVAEGAYIPVGALVRVIEVQGNRVVVELVDAPGWDETPGDVRKV